MTRAPRFYEVPIGTAVRSCRSAECGATVYFIPSPDSPGKFVPIDCSVEGGRAPTAAEAGTGVNHYATCKNPKRFHKPKGPAELPAEVRIEQREMPIDHRAPHCLFCGCTPAKPCRYVPATLEILQRAEESRLREIELMGEGVPPTPADSDWTGHVDCRLVQLDPPVCSAPPCMERRKDLPLAKRIGAVPVDPGADIVGMLTERERRMGGAA